MKVLPKITFIAVGLIAIGLALPKYLNTFIIIVVVSIAFMIDVLLLHLQNHIEIFEWFLDNTNFWDPVEGAKSIPASIRKLIRREEVDKNHESVK